MSNILEKAPREARRRESGPAEGEPQKADRESGRKGRESGPAEGFRGRADDPAQIRPRQVGGNRSQHRDRRCAHRGHFEVHLTIRTGAATLEHTD